MKFGPSNAPLVLDGGQPVVYEIGVVAVKEAALRQDALIDLVEG